MELSTLRDAERYLDQLINREKKTQFDYERLELAPIRALLSAIGSPERGLPCVHVAGSKGKGTVTLATESDDPMTLIREHEARVRKKRKK
jgi:folylpolyglutamate synthase/dihydropteroate synthase